MLKLTSPLTSHTAFCHQLWSTDIIAAVIANHFHIPTIVIVFFGLKGDFSEERKWDVGDRDAAATRPSWAWGRGVKGLRRLGLIEPAGPLQSGLAEYGAGSRRAGLLAMRAGAAAREGGTKQLSTAATAATAAAAAAAVAKASAGPFPPALTSISKF